jgi:ubiquinone/menaquinone biosynthesis C-methylase UbiE
MDYDKTEMPRAYDSGRSYSPEQLARWLDVVSESIGPVSTEMILDLGCGTGRYSNALANRLRGHVIGLEPSAKMLAEAKRKASTRVTLVRGSGESLPLASESIDMVFMSMVFHHFKDACAAVRECRRVLRAGRFACLRAGTIEQIDNYAYVPFFPGTRMILERTLTPRASIESTFVVGGFELVSHRLVPSQAAVDWADYADRLSHLADSVLVQLAQEEFVRGLDAMGRYAAGFAKKKPVTEPVDFFVFRSI